MICKGGGGCRAITLTTGVDNIIGTPGDDTISGVVTVKAGPAIDGTASTLTLADTINGGGGIDTLKISVDNSVAAGILAAAEIINVENIYIKQLDATGGNTGTYSLVNVTGETKVIDNGSVGNTTFTNIDKAAVGAQDITGAAASHTFVFKDSAFASTAALSVDVSNVGNKVTAAAQTIVVSQTTAPGAANGVSIAATGSNSIILSGAGANNIGTAAGIKTLTVTGSGSLKIDATSSLAAAAGANANNLAANLTTVDLAGNSGGVTMQVNKATVKVTGGTGNDAISIGGAMTSGATFNLGDGNDKLLKAAGGSIDANVVVDGGAGSDTIDNGLITVANGGVFKNFEKIALSTAGTTDVDLLTGSTITGLLINTGDVTGVVAQNVATNSTIEVTAVDASQTGTLTLAVKGAGASTTDVISFSFNGAAQAATPAAYNIAAGTVTIANVETINVTSGGADNTWNQLALTADKVKVINIDGAKNLDLSFVGTNGTNPVAGQGGAVSSIDGSSATGKLKIDLTNVVYDDKVGITVKGGTGNDTITTNASTATLTGTAGNDKYIVSATVAASAVDATTAATKMTMITDVNAGDMIDFTGFAGAGLTSLTKTQTDIATATDLTSAINLALENAAVNAAGKAAWFVYGGYTYVVNQGAADTGGAAANDFTAADAIVKLTGTVDLTNATIAANVLTVV